MSSPPVLYETKGGSAEKSFYLDEFRGNTLCISVRLSEIEAPGCAPWRLLRELAANHTRVVLLAGCSDPARKRKRLGEVVNGPPPRKNPVTVHAIERPSDGQLATVWNTLRRQPIFAATVPSRHLLARAEWITSRLRIQKWVIAQAGGGLRTPGGTQISFMDDSVLTETLRQGAAEWAGFEKRRTTLEAIQQALRNGVEAVNLCSPDRIATELYTYEGAGTLFTLEDYCRVERLGIDDYDEVERLLERGRREGFLKKRSRDEIDAILLNGFGATIGRNHLAGVCALLTTPYRRARAGEIAGLYTLTRFKSEGVGRRLLDHIAAGAKEAGLRYLFACTSDANAADFFTRQGFQSVGRSGVPAAKWRDYPRRRLDLVTVLRRDLN